MLSTVTAAWLSVGSCVAAALIEGLCAGRQVRPFFKEVRLPPYSAPLWVWSLIGAAYYLIFGFLLYRLFSHVPASGLSLTALALIGAMMLGNALSNLVIFRARNLRLSGKIGDAYALLDLLLVLVVARIDAVAASALAPYLVYRMYAVWWGRALARLNPSS